MKLSIKETNIELGERQVKEMSFSIGNLGVVMKILREMMYSNPIAAICREITCNARDAHREAGIPERPIQIHLPNKLDKNWKVKDWGPGISPDRMEEVFVRYGESTKRDANVQTGGFGLGAKTPFAKTNQFSIITTSPEEDESRTKRVYIAHIDEKDVGTLRLVFEEKNTEEPCGTEIIVPVEEKDFGDFIYNTINATQYWNSISGGVRPVITGNNYQYDDSDVLLEGTGWELLKKNNSYSTAKAILDGIPYPLNLSSLNYSYSSKEHILLNNKPICLYFDVGDLSPSANREQLQYDSKTISKITEKIEIVANEAFQKFQTELADKKTFREAVLFYKEFSNEYSFLLGTDSFFEWNGWKISSDTIRIPDFLAIEIFSYALYKGKIKKSSPNRITINKNGDLYLHDLKTKRIPRDKIQKIFDENKGLQFVQVISFSRDSKETINQWKNLNENPFDLNLLELKSLESIYVPKTEREKNKRALVKGTGAFIFDPNYYGNRVCDKYWNPNLEDDDDDDDDDIVYVILSGQNKRIFSDSKCLDQSFFIAARKYLGIKVYGIRKSDVGMIKSEWTPFVHYLKNKLEEVQKEENIDFEVLESEINRFRSSNLHYNMSSLINKLSKEKIKATSPINQYFTEASRLEGLVKNYGFMLQAYHFFNSNLEESEKKIETKLSKLANEINTRYKLLNYVNAYNVINGSEVTNLIYDYINMIDEKFEKDGQPLDNQDKMVKLVMV